jgi:copper chaperone CopZ
MNTSFRVNGMTCGGCEQSVARIIRQQPEVADVAVDRSREEALVSWAAGCDAQAIDQASRTICESVTAAGFDCSRN